ncbi:MAG: kelch repeat-containing protein, partial [Micromonospora sp.]
MRRNPRQIAALVAASTLVAGMLVGGGWWIGHSGTSPSGAPAPSISATPTTAPAPTPTTAPSTTPTAAPTRTAAALWRLLPPAPLTEWGYGVTAVWTGTEMLVYQAHPSASHPASTIGYAYNPATRRWRKLASIPVPKDDLEGRTNAVWTGTEMVVQGLVNAAYNPATNRWRPLGARAEIGEARYSPVVVWTGRQVLTWGGGACCAGDPAADGTAYTPSTDRFETLPASPLRGRIAAGTWTGTEMVVVGGQGAYDEERDRATVFADAAAYNPLTRTWRRLPPLPAPRRDATATWTGSEVLVVGGQGGYPGYRVYADGVAYNPATNRWRPVPAMPVERRDHTAVWTGDQLIVWGGRLMRDGVWIAPPRGYAYDPATRRWTALPTSPLRGRTGHFAAWTGTRMLI